MKNVFSLFLVSFPKFSFVGNLYAKPLLLLVALVPVKMISPAINIWDAFYVLSFFFIGDFLSGIGASYCEWKKTKSKDRWFFGKGEGFSSDKFKNMSIKILVYLGAPLVINKFQEVFRVKNISYSTIFEQDLSIATGLILLFCLNEGFSIFHENLPKCGFNLWAQIKKVLKFFREAKEEINEDIK